MKTHEIGRVRAPVGIRRDRRANLDVVVGTTDDVHGAHDDLHVGQGDLFAATTYTLGIP